MKTISSKSAAQRFAARRRSVFRGAQKKRKVDALLITDVHDIRYLTGVTEGAGSLLLGKGWAKVITSKMFGDCIASQCPGCDVIVKTGKKADDLVIKKLAANDHLRRIGFQKDLISLVRYESMCKRIGKNKLAPMTALVTGQRAIKDEDEIKTIQKAVRIAEKAFRELTGQGARKLIGRTELELAAELEYRMRMEGADRQGFPSTGIIVAAGANSASCHHFPTSRKVRRDDIVLFDWGAELDGYRSDITRVIFLGEVHPTFAEIFPVVRRAHAAAIQVLRPGVRSNTVHQTARDVIDEAGFGDQFPHGLGHGIGLQIHEHPFFGRADVPLKKNMVVTIEPGIYFAGLGGIRLEDDILLTAGGHKDLCTLPTRLESAVVQ